MRFYAQHLSGSVDAAIFFGDTYNTYILFLYVFREYFFSYTAALSLFVAERESVMEGLGLERGVRRRGKGGMCERERTRERGREREGEREKESERERKKEKEEEALANIFASIHFLFFLLFRLSA